MFHPRCLLAGTIGEKDAFVPLVDSSFQVNILNALAEVLSNPLSSSLSFSSLLSHLTLPLDVFSGQCKTF